MINGNSARAQRQRILDYLHSQPLDTLTARKELDVMHPAARVMELRTQGIGIKTIWIDRQSDCGKIHRILLVMCWLMRRQPHQPILETESIAKKPTFSSLSRRGKYENLRTTNQR